MLSFHGGPHHKQPEGEMSCRFAIVPCDTCRRFADSLDSGEYKSAIKKNNNTIRMIMNNPISIVNGVVISAVYEKGETFLHER